MNFTCYGVLMVFNFMGHDYPLDGGILMGHEDFQSTFTTFSQHFYCHEMAFVLGPLTFSWVKVIAKWYHENCIKTLLKVNHSKSRLPLILFNELSIVRE